MRTSRRHQLRSDQGGFALIEVLISALIVVMMTAAVVQTLTATGRASTEQRHRAQAFAIAQEDQERLRATQISTLQQGLAPRTVTLDGTPFSVTSTAQYITDKTGTARCGAEGKADYVQIGSSVTWPTMHEGAAPVQIESILSPVSGSVEATSGGIAVSLLNSREKGTARERGIAGVPITVKGPATFSGYTNSEGCALFGGEPVGNYTVTPKLPGTGWVDVNGEAPVPFPVSVAGGTTNYKEVHYDKGGSIKALFQVRPKLATVANPKREPVKANADSIVASNTGGAVRTFGSPGTEPTETVTGSGLYPFETSYAVWGGSCTPATTALQPEEAAKGFVVIPVGSGPENAGEVMVTLPALYLTVTNSKGTSAEKTTGVSGARVTLTDANCENSSKEKVVREYTTTATGSLGKLTTAPKYPTTEEPGVPTGEYTLCVSKANREVVKEKLIVKNVEKGLTLPIDLYETGSKKGTCP